jgi:hypothetical protein
MLDAMAVDRVGVAAAYLHELEVVVAGKFTDPRDQATCRRGIAILVDELHRLIQSLV